MYACNELVDPEETISEEENYFGTKKKIVNNNRILRGEEEDFKKTFTLVLNIIKKIIKIYLFHVIM